MNNNSKILFLIDNMTTLRFFLTIIEKLLEGSSNEVLMMSQDANIGRYVKNMFPGTSVISGHNPKVIDLFVPDVVICEQVWWRGVVPVLKRARAQNIPIVQYDHGSILHFSDFLLEGSEEECYRADILLCSHIFCWGQRAKETWVSFGVLEEKIHVTGAAQLDVLYGERPARNDVYDRLGISHDKKIILLYTALTGNVAKIDEANKLLIRQVEACLHDDRRYQLVVKSHPSEMLFFEKPIYPYSSETIIITNTHEDCPWPDIVRINADDVLSHAFAVIGFTSSSLINAFICDVPVIHIEVPFSYCHDFAEYCKGAAINLTDPADFPSALNSVELGNIPRDPFIAQQLNYNNDGRATERIICLLNSIIEEKRQGVDFYLTEEQELLTCINRYPFLPYPYKYLINYYSRVGDFDNEERWIRDYCRKFKDPSQIFKEVVSYHMNVRRDHVRAEKYISLYNNVKPLDTEPLKIDKRTLFTISFRRINGRRLLHKISDRILCKISFNRWLKNNRIVNVSND